MPLVYSTDLEIGQGLTQSVLCPHSEGSGLLQHEAGERNDVKT